MFWLMKNCSGGAVQGRVLQKLPQIASGQRSRVLLDRGNNTCQDGSLTGDPARRAQVALLVDGASKQSMAQEQQSWWSFVGTNHHALWAIHVPKWRADATKLELFLKPCSPTMKMGGVSFMWWSQSLCLWSHSCKNLDLQTNSSGQNFQRNA